MNSAPSENPPPQGTPPKQPAWLTAFGLFVPFLAGALFWSGIDHASHHETGSTILNLGGAAFLLFTAWRWSS